jgi:hypothetical protein
MAAHRVALDREIVASDGTAGPQFEKLAQILDFVAGGGRIGLTGVEHRHDVNFGFELPAHEHRQLESTACRIGKIISHDQTWNQ